MNAGLLRDKVTLQQPVGETRNDCNEIVAIYESAGTTWARIEPLTGNELFKAKTINAEMSYRVSMRYRSDIKTTWRIVDGTRTLEILSIADRNNRHVELELSCKEVH